jgi:hypothetical protein
VGVEVVHDQHDLLGVGVVGAEQPLDLTGPVDPGAAGLGVHPAPAGQGLGPAKDRAGAMAHVLGVLAPVAARHRGDRGAGMSQQLAGLLVHARRSPSAGWSSTSSDEGEVLFF